MMVLIIIAGVIVYLLAGRILINLLEEADIVPLVIDGSWRIFTHLFWPVFILWNLICSLGDYLSDSL